MPVISTLLAFHGPVMLVAWATYLPDCGRAAHHAAQAADARTDHQFPLNWRTARDGKSLHPSGPGEGNWHTARTTLLAAHMLAPGPSPEGSVWVMSFRSM